MKINTNTIKVLQSITIELSAEEAESIRKHTHCHYSSPPYPTDSSKGVYQLESRSELLFKIIAAIPGPDPMPENNRRIING